MSSGAFTARASGGTLARPEVCGNPTATSRLRKSGDKSPHSKGGAARTASCSADFQVCCIAGFQTRSRSEHPGPRGLPHTLESSWPLPIWKSAIQQVWKPALRGARLAPAGARSRYRRLMEIRRRRVACAKAVTSHRTPNRRDRFPSVFIGVYSWFLSSNGWFKAQCWKRNSFTFSRDHAMSSSARSRSGWEVMCWVAVAISAGFGGRQRAVR